MMPSHQPLITLAVASTFLSALSCAAFAEGEAKALPSSAYFLRYADDPVHWQPWGAAAFEQARKENKPLFVSIGFDASHPCALMHEESFRDPVIAAHLNRKFVNVLVDRVQRPDLDALYRIYQYPAGGGGSPTSVWITPEGTPFSVGNYFPPTSRDDSVPSLTKVIDHISTQWTRFPDYINKQSKRDFDQLRNRLAALDARAEEPTPSGAPALATLAYEALSSTFDPVMGGFTNPAKYPRATSLQFLVLLAAGEEEGSYRQRQILKMLTLTAHAIVRGGMWDHVEGGFHRGTVDDSWQVPRFEKMLPVQSELALALLDLHAFAPDPVFAEAVRRTLDFTVRDLRLPSGLFQTSLRSDSKPSPAAAAPIEGAYYTWSFEEFAAAVGAEDLPVLADIFQIRRGGNIDPGATKSTTLARTNILRRRIDESGLAARLGLTEGEWNETIARGVRNLAKARARRPHPEVDPSTPTAWNAEMASAFIRSAGVLGNPADLAVARDCLTTLLASRFDPTSGRLSHLDGNSGEVLAYSYATTIRALLDLYDATLEPGPIEIAADLQTRQIKFFWDDEKGGFFETLADAPDMLIRLKRFATEPAAGTNDISAANLRRLGDLMDDSTLRDRSAAIHRYSEALAMIAPAFEPGLVANALLLEEEPIQILLEAAVDSALADDIFRSLRAHPRARVSVFANQPGTKPSGFLFEHNIRLREALPSTATAPSFRIGRAFRFGPALTAVEELEKALMRP